MLCAAGLLNMRDVVAKQKTHQSVQLLCCISLRPGAQTECSWERLNGMPYTATPAWHLTGPAQQPSNRARTHIARCRECPSNKIIRTSKTMFCGLCTIAKRSMASGPAARTSNANWYEA